MTKESEDAPRVYSYIRFSTPEQAQGDSERRQIKAAKAFAEKKSLALDNELQMTDRGYSGYHGTHRKKGSLGIFLERVNEGEVPRGSYLIIENLDRLSREGVINTLQNIVLNIIDNGITIQTLYPEQDYSKENIDDKIIEFIAHLQRAHAESDRKSYLLKEVWKHKRKQIRENKGKLTNICPNWLRVEGDEFKIIEEAATTVKMIFDMKNDGLSIRAIERKLNAEAPWKPPYNPKRIGEGWRCSYINKILRTRAVIGEFQPYRYVVDELTDERKREKDGDPIASYYPAVVDPNLFNTVQQKLDEIKATRHNGGGRKGKVGNLFTHIAKCGYCDGSMHYVSKGNGPKYGRYLVCDNGNRGVIKNGKRVCESHSVRYDEFEQIVLKNCRRLKPQQVLPNEDEQKEICRNLQTRITGQEIEIKDIEKRREILLDQLSRTEDEEARSEYEKLRGQLLEDIKNRKNTIENDQTALRKTEHSSQSFKKWQKDIESLFKALKSGDVDIRLKMQAHLKEFIERIDVYGKGGEDTIDNIDEIIGECGMASDWGKVNRGAYKNFMRYIREQCLSSKGRFYQIHLKNFTARTKERVMKNGKRIVLGRSSRIVPIQVAPKSSLAYRMELIEDEDGKKGSRHFGPKLELLSNDFFDNRKR